MTPDNPNQDSQRPGRSNLGGSQVVDVLIIGAGISGLGSACHLQRECPDKSWLILEGRDAIGGTWDLFRYPGIRSDSDLYTFGYDFKPWHGQPIATAPEILRYLNEVVDENDLEPNIRFNHWVSNASWSTQDALLDGRDQHLRRPEEALPGSLSLHVPGLLQLRRGLSTRLPRRRGLSGNDHPSPEVAGRPRLHGQEDGGHRLRCHGGHDCPLGRRQGRARHPAAAFAVLLPRDGQQRGGRHHPGPARPRRAARLDSRR